MNFWGLMLMDDQFYNPVVSVTAEPSGWMNIDVRR